MSPGVYSNSCGSTNVSFAQGTYGSISGSAYGSFAQGTFEPVIPFGNPEEKEPENMEEKIEFLINRINPDVEKCCICKKWVDVTEEGIHSQSVMIGSGKIVFCKECFKLGVGGSYGSFTQGTFTTASPQNYTQGYKNNSYTQNTGTFTSSTTKPIGNHPQFSIGTNKKWILIRE